MLRPRALIALAGLLALLIVGAAALLRARSRTTPPPARRPSPWVVPRAHGIPKLITAPAPMAAEPRAAPANLIVRVEDVEGGAIPDARIAHQERELGATDEAGLLRLDTRALGLPAQGELEARAAGYGPLTVLYAVPGEVLFKLIVGSVVSGRVVQAGTDAGVAGLQVTANRQTTTSDQTGRFAIRDLPAGLTRLRARGEGWSGELPHPISLGLGRTVDDLRISVSRAFTLRGRVLQQGRPIAGEASVDGGGATARTTGGRFALVGVAPGTYRLEAFLEPSETFFTLGPATTATVVDRDVEVDVDLGARHPLAVEVVDGQGRPLPEVPITVEERNASSLVSLGASTGADGRCAFTGLLPGPVHVTLKLPPRETQTVAIPAGGPVRFVLDGRGSLAGRLVGADGRPSSRRFLELTGVTGDPGWSHSAADGSFRFDFLTAGTFTLGIGRPAETTREVTLRPGEHRGDLVITLPAENGQLVGRVVDAAGAPAADVLVSRHLFDASMIYGGGFHRGEAVTTTDDSGAFRFQAVSPERRYTLTGYRITGESAVALDVRTGAPALLRLEAKASLRVRARGGEGLGIFTMVRVMDGDKTLGFTSHHQAGAPLQIDGLPVGTWEVRVQRSSHSAITRAVFEPGKTTELDLELKPAADD